jgi:hypothetical protein
MVPVVMLGINTGALSSILTLLRLTMTCPSFEHFPVIYLMAVAVRAALLIPENDVWMHNALLTRMMDVTQVAHQAFSLLTNMLATSIIALKAWCVYVDGVLASY